MAKYMSDKSGRLVGKNDTVVLNNEHLLVVEIGEKNVKFKRENGKFFIMLKETAAKTISVVEEKFKFTRPNLTEAVADILEKTKTTEFLAAEAQPDLDMGKLNEYGLKTAFGTKNVYGNKIKPFKAEDAEKYTTAKEKVNESRSFTIKSSSDRSVILIVPGITEKDVNFINSAMKSPEAAWLSNKPNEKDYLFINKNALLTYALRQLL